MNKTNISELKNLFGQEITLKAWIDNIRNLQYVQFVILRDETGKVQMTIEKNDDNKSLNEIIDNLTLESTVTIKGLIEQNEKVKLNGMEIIPNEIKVTSKSLEELPINIKDKDKSLRDTRLDYRFLDLRREDNNLIFRIQSTILNSFRNYWYNHNYTEIITPKISASSAESGAEMFKIDYFGKKACLSQSPQFYKQMAIASGYDKVFEIAPVFRAENSHTSFHQTEIEMVDAEIGFIDSYEDVMDMEEDLLKVAFNNVKEKHGEDIKRLFNIDFENINYSFPRITFDEAKKTIKNTYNYTGEIEKDFDRKEEELIGKYVKNKYKSDFVFITNYPYEARSFYVMKDENNITQTYDLIYKGLEITSGAQREHRPDILEKQIKEKGIDPKLLAFYIDFFKYGCPPHGGFGLGLSRVLMKILEIDNIKEATFIYRGPTRLNP